MRCVILVICAVLIFGTSDCGAQSPTAVLNGGIQTYSISWADVKKQTEKSLTGSCPCDITHAVCDVHCCCDTDCSSDAVAAFKSAQSCLYEGQKLGELDYCLPKSEISKVNIPSSKGFFTVTKKDAEQDFMSQLLCVSSDRNPNLGAKYQDPTAKDTDIARLRSSCPASQQANTLSSGSYTWQAAVHTQYTYGAQTSSSRFTLPVAAFSSACEDVQRVGFMVPLPSDPEEAFSSCRRPITTLQQLQELCTSTPAASAARFASATYAASPSDTTFSVPTLLVSLQVMDPITGALTALPTSSSPPSPTFNATTSTCSHLVHQAIFTFIYNPSSGSLQASTPVQLSLVLTDATLPAPTDPDPLFLQRIKVSWVPTGLAGSVPEAFSGNPGYIPSYPVLAGVVVTDPQLATTTAVQRYFEGFPVPTAGAGGLCSARASMPLRYGTNATSSCHVRLTAAELQSWCGQGAGGIAAALVGEIYSDLVAAKVVLGVWGNSAHTDVAQWIQIAAAAPSVEPTWDGQTSTCTNLPIGFDIRLLTAMADAAAVPKLKLLAAASCFSTGTWQFVNADKTQAQTFVVQHSVMFSALQQDPAKMARRHVPPLSPNLPADLLYPFLD